MKTPLVTITGGPGSGKTTLVEALAAREHATCTEAAFDVITALSALIGELGVREWRLQHPSAFQDLISRAQFEAEAAALARPAPLVVLDRCLIDGVGYASHYGVVVPEWLGDVSLRERYALVFMLDPLPNLPPRPEPWRIANTLEKSLAVQHSLEHAYSSFGYVPIPVPSSDLDDRVRLVERHLSALASAF